MINLKKMTKFVKKDKNVKAKKDKNDKFVKENKNR